MTFKYSGQTIKCSSYTRTQRCHTNNYLSANCSGGTKCRKVFASNNQYQNYWRWLDNY